MITLQQYHIATAAAAFSYCNTITVEGEGGREGGEGGRGRGGREEGRGRARTGLKGVASRSCAVAPWVTAGGGGE